MGILTYAASGMGALFGVVNKSIPVVIDALKAGLVRAAEGVRDGWELMIDRFERGVEALRKPEKGGESSNSDKLRSLEGELADVNDRIMGLRKVFTNNGSLNEDQKIEWRSLFMRRKELQDEIGGYREVAAASRIVRSEEFVKKFIIDGDNAHVLEFNAFSNILGKTCPKCGMAMKIQWRNGLRRVAPSDMFWGCTGWYVVRQGNRSCRYTEPVTTEDLQLLVCADTPELTVSYDEFSGIFSDPAVERIVDERVSDLMSDLSSSKEGVYLAYCPVHGESMRLRRKREASGLLDSYFLSCRCWEPNGQGCQFVEKLRSPAQLAALLKSETGRGVL